MIERKERYIIIVDTEVIDPPPFGRELEIRYVTDLEVERFLEDRERALPNGYVEDDDGDLFVSFAVHCAKSRWLDFGKETFKIAEELLYRTDTFLLRGQYEGIMEILDAKRDPVVHVVDKRARRAEQ